MPSLRRKALLSSSNQDGSIEYLQNMPTESAIAKSLASAGKRFESMSLLCEMLVGQLERQRREFQEIKAAIASDNGQEGREQVAPVDISLGMLDG